MDRRKHQKVCSCSRFSSEPIHNSETCDTDALLAFLGYCFLPDKVVEESQHLNGVPSSDATAAFSSASSCAFSTFWLFCLHIMNYWGKKRKLGSIEWGDCYFGYCYYYCFLDSSPSFFFEIFYFVRDKSFCSVQCCCGGTKRERKKDPLLHAVFKE